MAALADPLYLVPGNDRLAAHYARKTSIRIREQAANPYGLDWERDLEQLVIRYGNEVGWERGQGDPGAGGLVGDTRHIIGRQHPRESPVRPSAAVRCRSGGDPCRCVDDRGGAAAHGVRAVRTLRRSPSSRTRSAVCGGERNFSWSGAYRPASSEPTVAPQPDDPGPSRMEAARA